jgi:hypothetical protein
MDEKKPERDLFSLTQTELELILFENASDGFTPVLLDKFTDNEVLKLLGHPDFDSFTKDFADEIWEAATQLLEREIRK